MGFPPDLNQIPFRSVPIQTPTRPQPDPNQIPSRPQPDPIQTPTRPQPDPNQIPTRRTSGRRRRRSRRCMWSSLWGGCHAHLGMRLVRLSCAMLRCPPCPLSVVARRVVSWSVLIWGWGYTHLLMVVMAEVTWTTCISTNHRGYNHRGEGALNCWCMVRIE